MTAAPASAHHQARPSWAGRLPRLALAVAALLVLSEMLWLWQTWPVRELLQPPASAPPQT